MAQNHIQKGDVMDFANASGSDFVAGEVVVLGGGVGVALGDIADGETGSLAVTEVFEVPKNAGVIPQGAAVYFTSAGNATTTATGNTYGGIAFATAADGDASVQVKLNA